MSDSEQIRRDEEHLQLLKELEQLRLRAEQAEREQDETDRKNIELAGQLRLLKEERDEYRELGGDYNAALKAVSALVEALRRIADPTHSPKSEEAVLVQIEVERIAREALAKWEQAQ